MGESVATKREDVPMVLGFCSKEEGLYWGSAPALMGGARATRKFVYTLFFLYVSVISTG